MKTFFAKLPRPDLRWYGVALWVLIWLGYVLSFSLLLHNMIPFLEWQGLFTGMASYYAFLMLCTIPTWYFFIRILADKSWAVKLLLHAVLSVIFTVGVYEGYVVVFKWLAGLESVENTNLAQNHVWMLYSNALLYLIQFSIFHSVDSVAKLKEKEKQAAELKALAREREVAALKAQINPHFLFNTLNSINAMVTRDPEEARKMIVQLADLLRYALDSLNHMRIPLRKEVDFVKAFLDLEQKRFGERLQVDYDISAETLSVPVIPMVLQPLVENAVNHGIAPKEDGGKISLKIKPAFGRVDFDISDTGVGMNGRSSSAESKGIGLSNTDARLQKIYGSEAALSHGSLNGAGFQVKFSIPIKHEELVK